MTSTPVPKKRRKRDPAHELEKNVERIGSQPAFWSDLYVVLLKMSWGRLLLCFVLIFMLFNALFAFAFLAIDASIDKAQPGSFLDAFFFSVQTSTTIGYGGMTPKGVAANILVSLESMMGLMGFALATGLAFGKFSQPNARVLYSENMIISERNGIPTLSFRLANERTSRIVEANIRVTVLLDEITKEGHSLKKLHDLELARSISPMFSLSWLVMHTIDAESPIYGMALDELEEHNARFVISLTGIDGVFSQTIHSNYIYTVDDIVWGGDFVDIISTRDDGVLQLNLNKFHDINPPHNPTPR